MGLRLLLAALLTTLVAAVPATASATVRTSPVGALTQLSGADGCIVGAGNHARHCATARALAGPGAFVGSHAVAVSPDGHNVYVAAANANAIVAFTRDPRTGALTQPDGAAGCIALGAVDGCAPATGLDGPNAVVVSPDGRAVYATARDSNSVVAFARDLTTGALTQVGCASSSDAVCTPVGSLGGADTVAISPDGTSVYVGAFASNAVVVFTRNAVTGTLAQTGCLTAGGAEGCTAVAGLQGVEGVTVSPDGTNVYAAAALSNTVFAFARSTSGALTPTSCMGGADPACTPARSLTGLNDLVVSPDGSTLYATAVLSNGMAIFARGAGGALTQATSAAGCIAGLPAPACSLGRGFSGPEGVAISADGRTVYTASFGGAIAVFDTASRQLDGRAGCVTTRPSLLCQRGRALLGASSVEVSPDGRNVYVASFLSGSITVFRRAAGS
jgi:DNA-binding beta-propeller fold protein YncE